MAAENIEVGWAEHYGAPSRGIDHLGIRTAGEAAYARLLDFVTTVSWRPRYLSMLCWALGRAWDEHARERPDGSAEVDKKPWRAAVRRADHLVAAATLAVSPELERVNGSRTINAALARGGEFALGGTYAETSTLGLYNGTLRALGLTRERGGFDEPTDLGRELGALFGGAPELGTLADADAVPLPSLQTLGTHVHLARVPDDEAALIRERTMRWDALLCDDPAGWSGQTVALFLRFRELSGSRGGVETLRGAMVLGAVDEGRLDAHARLPVLPRWTMYQAHANAALALETFFAVYLATARARALEAGRIDVRNAAVVDACTSAVRRAQLGGRVGSVIPSEPQFEQHSLATRIKQLRHDLVEQRGELLASALRLFVASIEHQRQLVEQHGAGVWVGATSAGRLPPSELIRALDDLRSTNAIDAVAVLIERAVRQHERTALRKLMANPALDTIKVLRDGAGVRVVADHWPEHSYPRFANAIVYLTDLGLLDAGGAPSAAGNAVLHRALGAT